MDENDMIEIEKRYDSGVVGTTYTIKVERRGENTFITLKAQEKPYKLTVNIKNLQEILEG